MTTSSNFVALIAKDPVVGQRIANLLAAIPTVAVKKQAATLTDIKHQLPDLAREKDVIIFFTQKSTDQDVLALQGIRRAGNGRATILALTDSTATLADVRRLTRAGVSEVLPDSLTFEELEEQILNSASRQIKAGTSANVGTEALGKVISVTQARGGIGSTTLAVNLADHLQGRSGLIKKTSSNRVALVDLDLQFGAVSSFVDVEPNDVLYQMAMDGTEPDSVFLRQSMTQLSSGLYVLAAPARFAPLGALQKKQLSALIGILRKEFDFVVVDLPRALVDWISPILKHSDRMLMVTDSSVPSIHQARRLIDFYTEDNLGLQIEIVVNHEVKPLIQGRHHTEASKVLERPLKYWLPDDPKAAREAVDRGVPLSDAAARSPLNKSIHRLAHSLIAGFSAQAIAQQTI